MCLTCQTTEKDPGKGALYEPEQVEIQKDWPDRQLQEARIKALLRHSSCCGAVHVPEQLVLPGFPQARQLRHRHLNTHWGRAATGKKVLCLCMQGHSSRV